MLNKVLVSEFTDGVSFVLNCQVQVPVHYLTAVLLTWCVCTTFSVNGISR